jgi:aryl sulfotransferase
MVADSARWDSFVFRPGDIVISTPAKSGTTWMQMICALLVLQTPDFERPLGRLSPWLDLETRPLHEVLGDLEAQPHRRFLKTHTPLDGLPFDERVTYVCVGRDPRDCAFSARNHLRNMDLDGALEVVEAVVGPEEMGKRLPKRPPPPPESELDWFWSWVELARPPTETVMSLRATLHHLSTFWPVRDRDNVVLLHYDHLVDDLEGQMRRLAGRLDIAVAEDRWPELVRAATFDEMRRRADQVAPDVSERLWFDNRRFFHRGRSGQWRSVLGPEDLARYRARVAELADPDLAAWLHRE